MGEGYITLKQQATAEGVTGCDLSIPYLAFYGDWDQAPVIDIGYYWQKLQGEPNFRQPVSELRRQHALRNGQLFMCSAETPMRRSWPTIQSTIRSLPCARTAIMTRST